MKTRTKVATRRRRKVAAHLRRRKISRLQAAENSTRPLARGERYHRPNKKQIRLYLDADVLAWFKRDGRGYQTRINRALRQIMEDEKMNSGECLE